MTVEQTLLEKLVNSYNEFMRIMEHTIRTLHTPLNKSSNDKNLSKDIISEQPKIQVREVGTTNPFETPTNTKTKWSVSDEATIHYCAKETTPNSQRTLSYLMKKISPSHTIASVRSKINRMGYSVVKGIVCKKS